MPAVTRDEMLEAAARLGFSIPEGHEEDYMQMLSKTDAAAQALIDEEDYIPIHDPLFSRSNVHWPAPGSAENPNRAWAWKADIGESIESTGKLLSGKTVVFKDTICVAGVPLMFGTNAFENFIPNVDATVVTRVLEHGGHVAGKAACENFSHGPNSSSSPQGPIENPHAKGFSAGGSSSGCGSLIGGGVVDMGIGGDQGGSIRIPACLCGLVGLKPTFGMVPYTGVLSSDAGTDHVGPMARTVLDTAALLQAVAGYDDIDDRQLGAPLPAQLPNYIDLLKASTGVKGMRIAYLKEGFEVPVMTDAVRSCVMDAVRAFEGMGATVEEVSVPMHKLAPTMLHVVNKFASGGTRLGRQVGRRGLYLNSYWDQLLPWDQNKYDKAKYFVTSTAMSSEYGWIKYPTAYGKAINLSRKLKHLYDGLLTQYDVVVMPCCPQPARRHIPPESGPLTWNETAPGVTANTGATNLTGHPSLTIPCGTTPPVAEDIREPGDSALKLPVGLMLMGKMWDEETILKVGDAWERAHDWTTRHYEK